MVTVKDTIATQLGMASKPMVTAVGSPSVTGTSSVPVAPRRRSSVRWSVSDSMSRKASRFLDAVEAHWGPIDVLVNNAGVMWVGDFDAEPEDAVHSYLEVNLHGVIRGVKAAAPRMRTRGGGQIVTIASAASKVSPPGEATYAATKHGVLGYLRAVRAELRGSGVVLSVIMPGVVDTDLARGTATGAARQRQPAVVARAVVAVIERPRFEVTMPRSLGRGVAPSELLPQVVRDFVLARLVPNQITSTDQVARRHYQDGSFQREPAC